MVVVEVAHAQQEGAGQGRLGGQVEDGALTTYGFVHHDAGAQAARIADQVLRGADPGTLPVENTESFFAINLDTAEQIDLEISSAILQRAQIILRGDDEE